MRQNYVENVSYSKKKNIMYFDYSACLYRLNPPLSEKI